MKQILFISIICLVSVITLTSGPCDLPAGCPDKKFAYSRCLNGVLSNWCSSNPFYDKSTGTFVQPIRFTCFTNDLDNSFTVIKHSVHYSGYQYIQHFKDDGPTGYPDYGTFHDGMKIFSADSSHTDISANYSDGDTITVPYFTSELVTIDTDNPCNESIQESKVNGTIVFNKSDMDNIYNAAKSKWTNLCSAGCSEPP